MPHTIQVHYIIPDSNVQNTQKTLQNYGIQDIEVVKIINVYKLDSQLSPQQLEQISHLLVNPVIEDKTIDDVYIPENFDAVIEIGFLPGVKDNIGDTVKKEIYEHLNLEVPVYTAKRYYLKSKNKLLDDTKLKQIGEILANPLINHIRYGSKDKFIQEFVKNKKIFIPKVKIQHKPNVDTIDILNMSDEELAILWKQWIPNPDWSKRWPLALNLEEMKIIQQYFKNLWRNPTDVELETIAQAWSEHCRHKIFNNPLDEIKDWLFKTYIKKATEQIKKIKWEKDFTVSVFEDNAWIIEFDKDHYIAFKVETHNSPSALDPFGWAITGILGVNRDIIWVGLGGLPVMNTYFFCFGDPRDTTLLYRGPNRTMKMLSPKQIMDWVIKGVNEWWNQSWIPTPLWWIYIHKNYAGKPLVYVWTIGILPKTVNNKPSYHKSAQPGDYIVMIGWRVGKDGIHWATFSSEELTEWSPVTAVQIGDAITQKKLSDALIKEARDKGLYNSITDFGAWGFAVAASEMATEAGGAHLDLWKVPLKYHWLDPWEIMISESQERMLLAVPKDKWPELKKLLDKRDVEATIVGEFNNSWKFTAEYNWQKVAELDLEFLLKGYPKLHQKSKKVEYKYPEPNIDTSNLQEDILKILQNFNIGSYKFISQQYDHEVQGNSVLKPLQWKWLVNADAVAIKPVHSSPKVAIISYGINPTYSFINTYHMAACAIDTAIRNAICAGADLDHLALLDNFSWCSSNEPERLAQLKDAVKAIYDVALEYQTPFISWKDSMFNDFKWYDENGNPIKISVPPTLLISAIGVVDNDENLVSIDFKSDWDLIYLLGDTYDELGASQYYALKGEESDQEFIGNNVPKVNVEKNKKLYQALSKAIKQGLIKSAKSVHLGGLAVALAKSAIAWDYGIDVDLSKINDLQDYINLFSESPWRIIVSISPEHQKQFETLMADNPVYLIGKTIKDKKFKIKLKNSYIDIPLDKLSKAYHNAFEDF